MCVTLLFPDVEENKFSVVLYEVDPIDMTVQNLSINYCLVKSGIGKSTGKWFVYHVFLNLKVLIQI